MTAPHSASHEGYKPQLDGVRAFCIIATIFNHIPNTPSIINGSVGVDVFFALSGWLITWLLLREKQETGRIDLASFYVRRAFRILPLYFLTVFLYAVLALGGAKENGAGELRTLLPYLLTMNMEYRPADAGTLFGHAWTLGIEEKFYLVWPLIVAMTARTPLLALVFGAGVIALLWTAFGVSPEVARGYVGLGFGAALAMTVSRSTRWLDLLRRQPLANLLVPVLAIPYVALVVDPRPFAWNVVISILAAGLIASLWFAPWQVASRFLSLPLLAWLGRLTYAIYLIQSIAIRATETVLAKLGFYPTGLALFVLVYPVCVAAAWIAHMLVEKPMIRLGKRITAELRNRRSVSPV